MRKPNSLTPFEIQIIDDLWEDYMYNVRDLNKFIEIAKHFANDHQLTFESSKFHDDILLIIRWQE